MTITWVLFLVPVMFALAVLIPVAWVAVGAYRCYRAERAVTCPADGQCSLIRLDAGRAARTALLGAVDLRVKTCSLWPGRSGCEAECLTQVEVS
jgi:hypothetical protein